MQLRFLLLTFLLMLPIFVHPQARAQDVDGQAKQESLSFGLQEQAEVWTNLAGGRRRGVTGNGLLTLNMNADLGALAGLDGWRLYGSVVQIHGRGVAQDLVGNIQTVSGLEATRATKLYNLWVEKKLLDGRLDLRIGQEGANDEMMISQQAQIFLNSSFGYPALMAANLPSGGPNFPIAAPMARLNVRFGEALSWSGAIFNGDPAGPGNGDPQIRNRYGVAFRLRDAPLIFNELWFRPEGAFAGSLPGLWKVGLWRNDGDFTDQRFDPTGGKLAITGASGFQQMRSGAGLTRKLAFIPSRS